ncbi:MAG: hypothetical protein AAF539_06685 [Planctomycetota bacterium]
MDQPCVWTRLFERFVTRRDRGVIEFEVETSMPLRKLWNTLRGRDTTSAKPHAELDSKRPSGATRPASSPQNETAAAKKPDVSASSRRSVLSIASRSPIQRLLRDIPASACRVLEIGIGDGQRTAGLIDAFSQRLGDHIDDLRYTVIDQFEMRGGAVTLRAFHASMAGLKNRPIIVPQSPAQGMMDVAHRVGVMDVILVDADLSVIQQDQIELLLNKLMHPSTQLMKFDGERWMKTTASELAVVDTRAVA